MKSRSRINQKVTPAVLTPDRGTEGKVQIGGRVSKPMNNRLKISAVLSDQSKDQILEDALAVYYGTADHQTLERRKAVLEAVSELKEGKLPFESPLTPNKDNATLTSRGDSANLAASGEGVVAQLVEHHNGIVLRFQNYKSADKQLSLFKKPHQK